jgi:hypothetical protein
MLALSHREEHSGMRPLLIGTAHTERGDGHVGIDVVRRVPAHGFDVLTCTGSAAGLFDVWEGRDVVAVVPTRSGQPVGTVMSLDIRDAISHPWWVETDHMGVAQAYVLAQSMGRAPASLTIVGVEVPRHHRGRLGSRMVATAVDVAVAHVMNALAALADQEEPASA